MSNEFEEEEEPTPAKPETQWVACDDIELDEMCANYRALESDTKLHESVAEEQRKRLKAMASQIQAKMGGHKHVRTSFGYMLEWKIVKNKGYTVEPFSGERWQLRSPY